jgi:hypothetical protein
MHGLWIEQPILKQKPKTQENKKSISQVPARKLQLMPE